MDLETWRNGINVAIDNVLRLFKDGQLLLDNDSYGHACFSFITAFEEMAVAYFIMGNYDTPKPNKLKKFLTHKKKIFASNFVNLIRSGAPFGNMRKLYEALMKDKEKDYRFDKKNKSEVSKVMEGIQEEENLWYLRIHGIYVTLNNSRTDFVDPTKIDKSHAQKLKGKLEEALIHLQVERDVIVKYGITGATVDMEGFENIIEALSHLEIFTDIIEKGSIEKLSRLKKLSPFLKDLITNMVLDNFPMKHEELEIEITELNDENLGKFLLVFFYELLKSYWSEFKKPVLSSDKSIEAMKYMLERREFYAVDKSEFYELIFEIVEMVIKADGDLEEFRKLFKSNL